jgi:hypothetical protein
VTSVAMEDAWCIGRLSLSCWWRAPAASAARFVGAGEGLGYVLVTANGRLDTALVFAAIIVLVVLGLLLFGVVSLIERLVIPWRVSQRSNARQGRGTWLTTLPGEDSAPSPGQRLD